MRNQFELNGNNLMFKRPDGSRRSVNCSVDHVLATVLFGGVGRARAQRPGDSNRRVTDLNHQGVVLRQELHGDQSAHFMASHDGLLINAGRFADDQTCCAKGENFVLKGQGADRTAIQRARSSTDGNYVVMGFAQDANVLCGPAAYVNSEVAAVLSSHDVFINTKYRAIPKWKKMQILFNVVKDDDRCLALSNTAQLALLNLLFKAVPDFEFDEKKEFYKNIEEMMASVVVPIQEGTYVDNISAERQEILAPLIAQIRDNLLANNDDITARMETELSRYPQPHHQHGAASKTPSSSPTPSSSLTAGGVSKHEKVPAHAGGPDSGAGAEQAEAQFFDANAYYDGGLDAFHDEIWKGSPQTPTTQEIRRQLQRIDTTESKGGATLTQLRALIAEHKSKGTLSGPLLCSAVHIYKEA